MKKVILFLMVAVSVIASPFMDHPNVLVALPAPSNGEYYTLDLNQLQRQSPQNTVYYTGGVVGYFANEWRLPIWTTPQVLDKKDIPWVLRDNDEVRNNVYVPVVVPVVPRHDDPFCVPSNPVPEPSSFACFLIGIGMIIVGVRNGKKNRV
jgi:hypothetical protein